MKLPPKSASYVRRVHYGRYVAACLRRKGLKAEAKEVEAKTNQVKAAGRRAEDAEEPVETAMAYRDGAVLDVNEKAQNFRLKLASRSLTAHEEAPYSVIFHKGIAYYTGATMDLKEPRYRELVTRVSTALPDDDALKAPLISDVTTDIEGYVASSSALADARTAHGISRTDLDKAVGEWETLMEKVYGDLISAVGKKAAERFFPPPKRPRASEEKTEPAPKA